MFVCVIKWWRVKLGNNFTRVLSKSYPNNFPSLQAREIIRIWTKRKWNYSLINFHEYTIWLPINIIGDELH